MKAEIEKYIREVLGLDDDETVTMLLDEYIGTMKKIVAQLKPTVESGDLAQLRKLAHTLKGCAGNIGHEPMRAQCLALEEASRNGIAAECPAKIAEIEALSGQLLNEF